MMRILLSEYMNSNISALYGYYVKHIKDKRPNIKVDYYKAPMNLDIKHYISRIRQIIGSYDWVISDYQSRLFSRGKKSIYIFHGAITKEHPGFNERKSKAAIDAVIRFKKDVDYVVCLSDDDGNHFYKYPEMEKQLTFIPLGLPRNDCLWDSEYIEASNFKFRNDYGIPKESKIVLYAPTFREFEAASPILSFDDSEIDKINLALEKHNAILVYRPHYIRWNINQKDLSRIERCKVVTANIEKNTQKILCASDCLMTDYSSVFVDFLLLDRPISFFLYDYDEYIKDRGIILDFTSDRDAPGDKLFNTTSFAEALEKVLTQGQDFSNSRKLARNRFYKYCDGNSCKRLWDYILSC